MRMCAPLICVINCCCVYGEERRIGGVGERCGFLNSWQVIHSRVELFFLVRLINVEWGDLDALMVLVHGKICVCVFGMK